MQEIWKDIVGYEGLYQVSNLGRVKSLDRYVGHNKGGKRLYKGSIIKQGLCKQGYYIVQLCKNNKAKTKRVNRLVAQAFLDNPNNLPQVNHIDKNKYNNKVENLEWITSKDNTRYSRCLKVDQYDLENNYIRTWESASDVHSELNYNISNIHQCCRNKRRTAHNYIWKFHKDIA